MDRGKTIWQFVKVSARPFVTIKWTRARSDDPTADVIKNRRAQSRARLCAWACSCAKRRQRISRRRLSALREAEVSSIAADKDVERETECLAAAPGL